jgi:hypothetical protein
VRFRPYQLPAGTRLVRVASDALGASEPSASTTPRRFSPVRDGRGRVVPVLYAGEDLGCALGETVFHDLDDDSGNPAEVLRADLLALRAATLATKRDLTLSDLRDQALTETYHVRRDEVIDTPPADYPTTALWARRCWQSTEHAGLVWNSRRSPDRHSYVLFVQAGGPAGRLVRRRHDLDVAAAPVPLWDGPGLGAVMTAATDRNVTVIIP